MYKAILSTTVIPIDGTYRIKTLPHGKINLSGMPHYCEHPDTAALIESFGAVCVPIQQGKSTRAKDGFTNPHQNVTLTEIEFREIERIE
jgi:hypothetical protein